VSNFLSDNSVSFLLLIVNIFLICVAHRLCSCLRTSHPLRKMVSEEKWHMISGQVINNIMPLTLPWIFFISQSGSYHFLCKANSAIYFIFFLGFGILFPIYYFFELLSRRERGLLSWRIEKKKATELNPRQNYLIKFRLKVKKPSRRKGG
jgi:hypothetical protein